jgi:hypothetical protein
MRKVSQAIAARIVGSTEAAMKTLRHVHPALRKLGDREGREVRLDLAEVAIFGLVNEFIRNSLTTHQAVEKALRWRPALDAVFLGASDESHYAVEVRMPDGSKHHVLAVGQADLAVHFAAMPHTEAVYVVNLSRLAAKIQTGWLAAHLGPAAARADLEANLRDATPEMRQAQLALFDGLVARMKLPAVPDVQAAYLHAEPVPLPTPAAEEKPAKVTAK